MSETRLMKKRNNYTVINPKGYVFQYSRAGWHISWMIVWIIGLVTGFLFQVEYLSAFKGLLYFLIENPR